MSLGQVAELLFLFITTGILIKCGFRKTLSFGLLAMFLRYISFYLGVELDQQWMHIVGILTHGLIFGLFFVGGQVYTDKIAPKEIRAQAQGFLFFLIWGIGYLIGTLFNGFMIENFRLENKCNWTVLFGVSSAFTLILIILFILFFRPKEKLD
jgi:MFS family permease